MKLAPTSVTATVKESHMALPVTKSGGKVAPCPSRQRY